VVSPAVRSARTPSRPPPAAAAVLPVARVAVDVPLAHLDRPFDYLVPERLSGTAVPGCRVRVRFAGRLTGGYLLGRATASDHPGTLAYLERVVSPEPVLTPEMAGLARAVADRYGGTVADVLRLAIPPRHARVENEGSRAGGPDPAAPAPASDDAGPDAAPPDPGPGSWARYTAGASFLNALASGRSPRAIWTALPGPDWPAEIARAAAATIAGGRGTLIIVPDARDLDSVDRALSAEPALAARGPHVCLSAGLGPAERYRRWLAVRRGGAMVVAGTRSAMFAPVARLGLVVIWDDGDDLHAEPRAPYPHAREVLALRAHRQGAAALIGGYSRTVEATQLIAAGWAHPLGSDRATVRRSAPVITATGDDAELARDAAARSARVPGLALRTARDALTRGPVLFQVPRRGYIVSAACERCREPARCAACGGPLALTAAGSAASCRWCGVPAAGRACARCGHTGLRASITGAGRTAEELGHAFPSVPVRTSGRTDVLTEVPSTPAVVVATPGAEPRVDGGYAAAVLLDGWMLLGRPSLRASEEALRRWMNAAALVRPGGPVVVLAESSLPAVQALVRWDPVLFAKRELAERAELGFPPAVRMASVTGPAEGVKELLSAAQLPAGADVLGPVPVASGPAGGGSSAGESVSGGLDEQVRVLVRVPRRAGAALAASLRAAQAIRTARKDARPVRVQLDPAELI
jgi:primosomal protein N' (replication factor Y) (superfamily II helicase)